MDDSELSPVIAGNNSVTDLFFFWSAAVVSNASNPKFKDVLLLLFRPSSEKLDSAFGYKLYTSRNKAKFLVFLELNLGI